MTRFDLTDIEWERLKPVLPPERSGKRGRPYKGHRMIIDGIRWVVRTGAPWRDLPERYGPHQTCFDRFTRWHRDGTWTGVLQALVGEVVEKEPAAFGEIYVDSTTTKAHPHAAGARHRAARPLKRGTRSLRLCAKRVNVSGVAVGA